MDVSYERGTPVPTTTVSHPEEEIAVPCPVMIGLRSCGLGVGFEVYGVECKVKSGWWRVEGLGCKVQDVGCRV